jgi:hypothetical protein
MGTFSVELVSFNPSFGRIVLWTWTWMAHKVELARPTIKRNAAERALKLRVVVMPLVGVMFFRRIEPTIGGGDGHFWNTLN